MVAHRPEPLRSPGRIAASCVACQHTAHGDRPVRHPLGRHTLHAEMDRTVLAAYGWMDLDLTTDFHLEHADEPDGKKRLRWSDARRDAVLGRLRALTASRGSEDGAMALCDLVCRAPSYLDPTQHSRVSRGPGTKRGRE